MPISLVTCFLGKYDVVRMNWCFSCQFWGQSTKDITSVNGTISWLPSCEHMPSFFNCIVFPKRETFELQLSIHKNYRAYIGLSQPLGYVYTSDHMPWQTFLNDLIGWGTNGSLTSFYTTSSNIRVTMSRKMMRRSCGSDIEMKVIVLLPHNLKWSRISGGHGFDQIFSRSLITLVKRPFAAVCVVEGRIGLNSSVLTFVEPKAADWEDKLT